MNRNAAAKEKTKDRLDKKRAKEKEQVVQKIAEFQPSGSSPDNAMVLGLIDPTTVYSPANLPRDMKVKDLLKRSDYNWFLKGACQTWECQPGDLENEYILVPPLRSPSMTVDEWFRSVSSSNSLPIPAVFYNFKEGRSTDRDSLLNQNKKLVAEVCELKERLATVETELNVLRASKALTHDIGQNVDASTVEEPSRKSASVQDVMNKFENLDVGLKKFDAEGERKAIERDDYFQETASKLNFHRERAFNQDY
jgi:hypothetical protein